jgi:hypothetical protein
VILRFALLLSAALCGSAGVSAAQAGSLRYCDRPADLRADQQDTLLLFGGIFKNALADSGQRVALIARSGLDLSRLQHRYSHAGVSLLDSDNAPWSVRQLYYACDEQRPRLFDQGLAGFVLGTEDPAIGYVSVVLLPPSAAQALERAALDKRRALSVLHPDYSANAHAWALRYQNCNQWLIELLAAAWAPPPAGEATPPASGTAARAAAQRWLNEQAYRPSEIQVGPVLRAVGAFVAWLHEDDHPAEDLDRSVYRVSMPASIEAFVQAHVPGAERLEFCHKDRRVVVRRGWTPIAEGCEPTDGDTVLPLD